MKETRTSGGSVTVGLPDLKKALADRAKVYEMAAAPCKGSLGLSLRKMHADVQAKRLEYRTKKVG